MREKGGNWKKEGKAGRDEGRKREGKKILITFSRTVFLYMLKH